MLPRLRDYALIFAGAIIQSLSMVLFYIPGHIVAGGVTGVSQLIGSFAGWPIGVLYIVLNIPLLFLGWRHLGGRRFLARTVFAVLTYSIGIDILKPFFPAEGLTSESMLNVLFGGVIGGLGVGLVLRGQGTTGGMDVLALLLKNWRGVPLSTSYVSTDVLVVLGAGVSFGWDLALYSVVALYVGGVAAEYAAEGARIVRTAVIVSAKPQAVADKIMADLQRGVTMWSGVGMYSKEERPVLFCTVTRAEVNPLKAIIREIDPQAFVVIGEAHEALGEGFKPLRS